MHDGLVTVFGGTGFLGRHAVRALAKAGYRVRVAVRHPASGYFLYPMGVPGQIQVIKASVGNERDVKAAIDGADAVVNLTGILRQSGRQRFGRIHRDAPGVIGKAALEAGVGAVVHVSALGASPKASSQYAKSKGEGELRLRENFPAAAILRPSLLFGPEDTFFNRFAALARISPVLPLIGGGRTKFQPVFVGDAAQAILKSVIDPGETRGRTYELGGPTVYTFKELINFILQETRRKRALVAVPFALASLQASLIELFPYAPLTVDQVRLLRTDNIVTKGALELDDLGISADSVEAIVPSYLWRFRPKGQFQDRSMPKLVG